MERSPSGSRVTISDVAESARVSKTTVSHVLSGKRPVAPLTRNRVLAAIAELGYRPDGVARTLRTRRSQMVAMIVPDIGNPFYTALARGLDHGMGGSEYRVVICNTDGRRDQELAFVAEMCDRGVDGIVLDSFAVSERALREVTENAVPVAWIGGGTLDHPGVDTVKADDERGAFDATIHLARAGRRRIAMITGTPGSGTPRNDGYARALEAAGMSVDTSLVRVGEWTSAGGARAMREIFEAREPPDAVFCANDLMAIGALETVRARGLRVPEDVALVGFDDIDAAAMVTPPLTTVLNPAYETGLTAGQLLASRMTGEYRGEARHAVLPCALVVRASA
ncbi:MAG TPA: LacI family DNA-binding transcriptional regulator [Actinomycetota bacterium]|nr:LacI family DNA-binding transcriptional regulator [Actinomycetota bacterium]